MTQILLPGLEVTTSVVTKLAMSREIVDRAIAEYSPYAIVIMFSGGDDSLTAYHVAKSLNISITHFMHGITNTGIVETTDFARSVGEQSGLKYLEANAGNAYADYVLRKGFFGVGDGAHEIAYHILKHRRFRTAISQEIRHRRPGRNILLINGARKQESGNRKRSMLNPIKEDSSNPCNIWVNLINDWTKLECLEFLDGQKRNPVTEILHRSGECLCGTMQSLETRREVSYWFPYWGRWLDGLEKDVCKRGFCWKWGDDLPEKIKAQKSREKQIKNGQLEWLPLCQNCQLGQAQ